MELIHYNDVFTLERGILQNSVFTIDGYSKQELNLLCLSTFGSFLLAPVVTYLIKNGQISDENLQLLGKIIDNKFMSSWQKYAESLSVSYEVLGTYMETQNQTYEGNVTVNNESNTKSDHDFYAQNSTESIDDTENNTTFNSNSTNNNRNSFERVTKGYSNIKPQSAIESEIAFRRKSLVDYVLEDLRNFSTLSIHI